MAITIRLSYIIQTTLIIITITETVQTGLLIITPMVIMVTEVLRQHAHLTELPHQRVLLPPHVHPTDHLLQPANLVRAQDPQELQLPTFHRDQVQVHREVVQEVAEAMEEEEEAGAEAEAEDDKLTGFFKKN